MPSVTRSLELLHADLEACRACPSMIGPVVHGPAVPSEILLIGQAPGPHEGSLGRPFAWTAGKTLFRWFREAVGASEDEVRARVYFSAVARCFPGKATSGGGDRRPDPDEVARCGTFLAREAAILAPRLVVPVGTLAIEQVLGAKTKLVDVVGAQKTAVFHQRAVDVIALPHPSGASTWHRMEPGKSLLAAALALLARHPAVVDAFGARPHAPRRPSR